MGVVLSFVPRVTKVQVAGAMKGVWSRGCATTIAHLQRPTTVVETTREVISPTEVKYLPCLRQHERVTNHTNKRSRSNLLVRGRPAEVGLDVVRVNVHRPLSIRLGAAEVSPPAESDKK